MKSNVLGSLIFGVLLCCFLRPLQAQQAPSESAKSLLVKPVIDSPNLSKWALVIGVDAYENPNVTPLKACGKDADAFAQYLRTEMKFPANSVRLMTDRATDPNQRPTYTKLKNAIRTFLAGIGPESEVVFFFSGHGARSDNQDLLVPLDGDPEDLKGSTISYTALRSELETKQPHRCIMITDACRNLLEGKALGDGFGADEMLKSPQFAELRSCRPKEISREMPDGEGSVFTYFLLQGLKGAPEAQNQEGVVTFDSLQFYVRASVRQFVSANFKGAQNPDGFSTFGSMVLSKGGAVILPLPPTQPPIVTRQSAIKRVAISLTEKRAGQKVSNSACEEELIKLLSQGKIKFVGSTDTMPKDTDFQQRLEWARKNRCDFLIEGQVTVANAKSPLPDWRAAQADVTLKIYDVTTGELFKAHSANQSGNSYVSNDMAAIVSAQRAAGILSKEILSTLTP